MNYPFFKSSWDRYSPRRSYQYPYHVDPPYYSASTVTPIKFDYDEWATSKLKPRRFTVPVYDSPLREPEYRILITSLGNLHNSALLSRCEYQGDMPSNILGFIQGVFCQKIDSLEEFEGDYIGERKYEGNLAANWGFSSGAGVHSRVRESRKVVTCELVNLQEIVDVLITEKIMEGEANEGPVGPEQNGFGSNNTENSSMKICQEFARARRDAMEEEPVDRSLDQSRGKEQVSSLSNVELSEHDYGRNNGSMESGD
eukprot:Gb_27701 [translate_table: standard]